MPKPIAPLDRSWLLIESPTSPTHVGAMLLFKKPMDAAEPRAGWRESGLITSGQSAKPIAGATAPNDAAGTRRTRL
jgi:hypothetical protein